MGCLGTGVQFPPPPFDSLRSLMAGHLTCFAGPICRIGRCEAGRMSRGSAASRGARISLFCDLADSRPNVLGLRSTVLRWQLLLRPHRRSPRAHGGAQRRARRRVDILSPARRAGPFRIVRSRAVGDCAGASTQALERSEEKGACRWRSESSQAAQSAPGASAQWLIGRRPDAQFHNRN